MEKPVLLLCTNREKIANGEKSKTMSASTDIVFSTLLT